jgi:hypothetical protein
VHSPVNGLVSYSRDNGLSALLSEGTVIETLEKSRRKAEGKAILDRLTGTAAKITALLIGLTVLLTQVPLFKNAAISAYCSFASCTYVLTYPDIVAVDGSHSKSGTLRNIRFSVVDNNGKHPDTYVAEWTWSGSGGTQKGSQTVVIDLKSGSGATVQSIRIGLDRSGCYYPGHEERHDGTLAISGRLIASINVAVTPVEGVQGPC